MLRSPNHYLFSFDYFSQFLKNDFTLVKLLFLDTSPTEADCQVHVIILNDFLFIESLINFNLRQFILWVQLLIIFFIKILISLLSSYLLQRKWVLVSARIFQTQLVYVFWLGWLIGQNTLCCILIFCPLLCKNTNCNITTNPIIVFIELYV